MIIAILTQSGLNFRQARFSQPPAGTYAVYHDDIAADAPAGPSAVLRHTYTVELYEPTFDDAAELRLESAIFAAGLGWTKTDRVWMQQEQRYRTTYEFTHINKRRL